MWRGWKKKPFYATEQAFEPNCTHLSDHGNTVCYYGSDMLFKAFSFLNQSYSCEDEKFAILFSIIFMLYTDDNDCNN